MYTSAGYLLLAHAGAPACPGDPCAHPPWFWREDAPCGGLPEWRHRAPHAAFGGSHRSVSSSKGVIRFLPREPRKRRCPATARDRCDRGQLHAAVERTTSCLVELRSSPWRRPTALACPARTRIRPLLE